MGISVSDAYLYVAEAGTGGVHPVACVPDPPSIFDPYFSDYTGRIVRIDSAGNKTVVADRFPSTLDNTNTVLGVSDIAFVGNTLYALVFAGCPRFFENVPSSVVRINGDGSWQVVADLSAYFRSHPVQEPPPSAPDGDFEPDGSPYTMISRGGDLYIVEANSGQLLRVTTQGEISRLRDLSVDHPVPTAIAFHAGDFYVGTFGSENTNGASLFIITRGGKKRTLFSGLNPVVGIAFHHDNLYLLETFSGEPYSPGTGRLLRVSRHGKVEKVRLVACGLTFPTAVTLGPDDALYISNVGYGADPAAAAGEVIRVPLDD